MQETNFLLYTTPAGDVRLDVVLMDESIWLTQKAMAELFSVGVPAISKHLKNIFDSGELQKELVISNLETTTRHGAMAGKTQTNKVDYYNLDAIISVGYRVNSTKATQFRIWATKTLKEYIIKGFAIDDERHKVSALDGIYYQRIINEQPKLLFDVFLSIFKTIGKEHYEMMMEEEIQE